VPTWIYPPLKLALFDGTSGVTNTIILFRLTMPSLNSNGWGEKQCNKVGRSRPSVQSLQLPAPEQVLAEIKAQGFDKLLITPF